MQNDYLDLRLERLEQIRKDFSEIIYILKKAAIRLAQNTAPHDY